MLTRQEPHVQLSAALDAKASLNIMSYHGSIHKRHIQCLSHMPGSHHVGSVGIYQGIAVDFLFAGVSLTTQFLIVIILQISRIVAAAHHTVHQYRNATLLSGFIHILSKMSIESATRNGVTVRELLLIVMTKLDDDIIAWLHLIQNFLPSAFIQEALRTSSVYGMIINDNLIVEATLEYHTPATLRIVSVISLLGSSRVTYDENRSFMTA